MFELLVPPEPAQLQKVGGDKKKFDLDLRPGLMVDAIQQLQDAGIEADVWKIEGLDRSEDCVKVVAAAHRGGRNQGGLHRPGPWRRRQEGARVAGGGGAVPGFIGFAVGRTTFWDPLIDMRHGKMTRDRGGDRDCPALSGVGEHLRESQGITAGTKVAFEKPIEVALWNSRAGERQPPVLLAPGEASGCPRPSPYLLIFGRLPREIVVGNLFSGRNNPCRRHLAWWCAPDGFSAVGPNGSVLSPESKKTSRDPGENPAANETGFSGGGSGVPPFGHAKSVGRIAAQGTGHPH